MLRIIYVYKKIQLQKIFRQTFENTHRQYKYVNGHRRK